MQDMPTDGSEEELHQEGPGDQGVVPVEGVVPPKKVYTEAEKLAWRKKRKNTNAVGNQAEKIAMAYLEGQGYMVHRAIRAYRPIGGGRMINFQTDVFSCVDLVAKKKGERTRWIQVTVDSGIGRKIDALSKVPWDNDHDSVEVWQWMNRKFEKGMTRETWKTWKHFKVRTLQDNYQSEKRIYPDPSNAPSSVGNA